MYSVKPVNQEKDYSKCWPLLSSTVCNSKIAFFKSHAAQILGNVKVATAIVVLISGNFTKNELLYIASGPKSQGRRSIMTKMASNYMIFIKIPLVNIFKMSGNG